MLADIWGKYEVQSVMKSQNFQPQQVFAADAKAGQKTSVHVLLADLKACSRAQDLRKGKKVHAEAVEYGHDSNIYVTSALVRMYAKCGSILDARRVFDSIQKPDVVCWNALLLGYAETGAGLVALDLFSRMKSSGYAPSSGTYVAALKACTSLTVDGNGCGKRKCLELGRQIHLAIGSTLDHCVQNTLIDMYAKCGSMLESHRVFDSMQKPDVVSWTALLLGYADIREGLVALDLFSRMKTSGCAPNSVTYVAALKACTSLAVDGDGNGKTNCLEWGREIHSEIGSNFNRYVLSALIDMYAKCGRMGNAQRVFDSIPKPDVMSWTSMLLGYAENGEGYLALDLFSTMKASGLAPDSVTYVAALKACTSVAVDGASNAKTNALERGRAIHSQIGRNLNHYVQNTLIDMYAKCCSMVDAHKVFDSMLKPDGVSWNALLLGYAVNGKGRIALDLFSRMKAIGCVPDSVTYIAALKACTSLTVDGDGNGKRSCLERGREIHSEIGRNVNDYIQNTLIDMYAKCGSMGDARHLFDSIQSPNVVCWNVLLLGYAENGEELVALDLFSNMKESGCAPDSVTYVAALKACGMIGALALGRSLHSEIKKFSAHVVTCLVDFYGKCGSMLEAHEVFGLHPKARDVATWNALLAGYGRFGDSNSVFNLFEAMQDQGFRPDAVTLVCMLSCCSHGGLVEKAREYFEGMDVRYGVTPTVMHYNCMVDVLGRANLLNEAAVLLQKMPCYPDDVTWMALLGACSKWMNVEIGKVAFQCLVGKDEKVSSAHVLMAHIYGNKGMRLEQERVLETRTRIGAWMLPGQAYVLNEVGKTVKFVAGERAPPEVKEKMQQFCNDMKEHGYVAKSYSMTCNASDVEAPCGHSEGFAVVYGILKTPPGEPIRVFSNMRMCDDCHGLIKMISKLSGRVLMVRDVSRFHVMVNGNCSCGEIW